MRTGEHLAQSLMHFREYDWSHGKRKTLFLGNIPKQVFPLDPIANWICQSKIRIRTLRQNKEDSE